MRTRENDPDVVLDRVLTEIREEQIHPDVVRQASDRVWSRISEGSPVERIRSCDDVRTLIPAYLDGTLGEARSVLVADHTRECVPCRRALTESRSHSVGGAGEVAPFPGRVARRRPMLFWGIAASLATALILSGLVAERVLRTDPRLATARVQSLEGALYRVAGSRSFSVGTGDLIPGGEVFRTAKGSRALVRLEDGSLVEMNERSELRVTARRSGATLHLTRGNIIVAAAPQGAGKLQVSTADCRVAVTGTIFSVNHGTKGSRVSVIEGEVRVRHSGSESVLEPGDQISTNPSLERVPVAAEISWSASVDEHLALLGELTNLRREIDAVSHVEPRHSTRLLDLVPEATVAYLSVPNLGTALGEAHRVLRERLESSAVLRRWWDETIGTPDADATFDDVVSRLQELGDHLREEIVIALVAGPDGNPDYVLGLAELSQPSDFRPFLEEQVRRLNESAGGRAVARIVLDPAAAVPAPDEQIFFWVHDDLLAVSNSLSHLRAVGVSPPAPGSIPSPFRASLARSYRDGTTILAGVDLHEIFGRTARGEGSGSEAETLRSLGVLDARHLIVEGDQDDDQMTYRAVLDFDQPRRGIASWLGEPAPLGSLEFVTADASLAAAFVTKNPIALAQELLEVLPIPRAELEQKLAEFEARQGVSVLRDFAAPLGGEFAFALDGPVLPNPAWKLVVEVYDPIRLQQTIEWVVREIGRAELPDGPTGIVLESDPDAEGWYTLRSSRMPFEVHYTFIDGYLVAAPTRGLIADAIAARNAGTCLPYSSRFVALLPRDGRANFSAVAYQNLGPILSPLSRMAGVQQEQLTPEQRRALEGFVGASSGSLAYAYGEPERIVFASTRPGGMFGEELDALLGVSGLIRAQRAIGLALESEGSSQP